MARVDSEAVTAEVHAASEKVARARAQLVALNRSLGEWIESSDDACSAARHHIQATSDSIIGQCRSVMDGTRASLGGIRGCDVPTSQEQRAPQPSDAYSPLRPPLDSPLYTRTLRAEEYPASFAAPHPGGAPPQPSRAAPLPHTLDGAQQPRQQISASPSRSRAELQTASMPAQYAPDSLSLEFPRLPPYDSLSGLDSPSGFWVALGHMLRMGRSSEPMRVIGLTTMHLESVQVRSRQLHSLLSPEHWDRVWHDARDSIPSSWYALLSLDVRAHATGGAAGGVSAVPPGLWTEGVLRQAASEACHLLRRALRRLDLTS